MEILAEKRAWSKSLLGAFRECHRKFAFSKITSSDKPEIKNAPFYDQAASLKKLKNRHIWTGNIIHETLGRALKQLRQGDTTPPEIAIIEELRVKMRREFKESQQGGADHNQLFEHAYAVTIPSEAWVQQWTKVETAVHWFFESKWFEKFKILEPHNWKTIDEILSFDVDGIKAFVKIDVGVEINDRFVLVDWKGARLRQEDQSNLRVAALYAHEVWDAPADKIDAFVVSLTEGKSKRCPISPEVLQETRDQIRRDCEIIQSVGQAHDIDPFSVPMTTHLGHCLRCNFQRLCHPEGIQTI